MLYTGNVAGLRPARAAVERRLNVDPLRRRPVDPTHVHFWCPINVTFFVYHHPYSLIIRFKLLCLNLYSIFPVSRKAERSHPGEG